VRISDGLGKDGLPFTFPAALTSEGMLEGYINLITLPFQGPIVSYLNPHDSFIYINFGPQGYKDAFYDKPTFLHEMTHVWQYQHGINVPANSAPRQLILGQDKTYGYEKPPTKNWEDYNVEQQAMIVQDWVTRGYSTKDEWFVYIRDYIRTGKTNSIGLRGLP